MTVMFPQSRHVAPKSRRDAVADEISANFNFIDNIQPPHRYIQVTYFQDCPNLLRLPWAWF
jgi:hypothetical protein